MSGPVDVLAVMQGCVVRVSNTSNHSGDGADHMSDQLRQARAAVADLIEAAEEACINRPLSSHRLRVALARIGGAA